MVARGSFNTAQLAFGFDPAVYRWAGGVVVDNSAPPITQPGDVWVLGAHRLMCGDSTVATDVARLMAGRVADFCHADPPYGMGKEADGVVNDNLYKADLDAFQMRWWRAWRPYLADNGSAFIWGNAADLWRLWYAAETGAAVRGLGGTEHLELRNEIVWDKQNIAGMASPGLTQYPTATERALFFQLGQQFLGNVNKDDFPDTWEPIRAYMAREAEATGLKSADVKRICGVSMFSHWFSQSQFTLAPEEQYNKLASACPGHFLKPWRELKREWDAVKSGPRREFNQSGGRSYFDNAHAAMTDVWTFSRVVGEERHGHATPKPVAMLARALKSSTPQGGIVVEPFIGSGSTIIAAETVGCACYGMEITPAYCDVTVRRWEAFTGKKAALEASPASRAP